MLPPAVAEKRAIVLPTESRGAIAVSFRPSMKRLQWCKNCGRVTESGSDLCPTCRDVPNLFLG